jgi:hypothetical protein
MPMPRFEVPAGAVDGANTVYTVSQPYMPGSTAVFLNGLLQEKSLDDGWFETDPGSGTITMKEAPQGTGTFPDVLQVFYLDTSPALPETEICIMSGRLVEIDIMKGNLIEEQPLFGVIRC